MRPGVSGRSRRSRSGPDFRAPAEYAGRSTAPAALGSLPHQPLSPAPLLSVTPRRYPGLISAVLGPTPCGVAPAQLPEGRLAGDTRTVPSTFWLSDRERLAFPPGRDYASGPWRRWGGVAWLLGPRPAARGSTRARAWLLSLEVSLPPKGGPVPILPKEERKKGRKGRRKGKNKKKSCSYLSQVSSTQFLPH